MADSKTRHLSTKRVKSGRQCLHHVDTLSIDIVDSKYIRLYGGKKLQFRSKSC